MDANDLNAELPPTLPPLEDIEEEEEEEDDEFPDEEEEEDEEEAASKDDAKKSVAAKQSMANKGRRRAGSVGFRKKRTAYDKKMRQSGKNTNKPYIASSIGDMCRLMIREACTENTLGMTEPPPVKFYDYWHNFKVSDSKDKIPANYVDLRRVSVPKLKMNTSSFDLFAKNAASEVSVHHQVLDTDEKKIDHLHILNPKLSDLWRGVRLSMSSESFISSSTKVSEPHWEVPLEEGWSDEDDEDVAAAALSDSDDEEVRASNSTIQPGKGKTDQGAGDNMHTTASQATAFSQSKASSTQSVVSLGAKQRKEIGAVAASIMHMEMEEAFLAMESALKGDHKDRNIIDHFMDDLDDTFLIDSVSYGQLPDAAFTHTFDYFNEDPVYKAKQEEEERQLTEALLAKQGGRRRKKKEEEEAKEAKKKGKKGKRKSDKKSTGNLKADLNGDGSESETDLESVIGKTSTVVEEIVVKEDYATCMINQKKRIEDRIQAAARSRSPMGTYIVPPGGLPLARTFDFVSPGPSDYSPNMAAVKPSPTGVFLARRWAKSIYETPGPGPGAYLPECRKCTAEMLNLHESERFEKSERDGPGPAEYDVKTMKIGKDKPKAIIFSRRPEIKIGCTTSEYTNCYGINRFGRRNPPNPLIVGRYSEKDKLPTVGPGEYDPYLVTDTKVGILMKSRIPPLGPGISPGFVDLPVMFGDTPGKSLGIRKFETLNADSPGPIYLLPAQNPKSMSMTFKPFPTQGREDEPSPIHYGVSPGNQSNKMRYATAPRALICGSHDLKYGIDNIPGPNKYNIKKCSCKLPITMKGRYATTSEVWPGPGEYVVGTSHLPKAPIAVFPHKKIDKPLPERSPGFVYTPKVEGRVRGGLMASRWRDPKNVTAGAGFVDLFGFTNRGKYSKIPISLKSRHTPFMHTKLSDAPEIPKKSGCAKNPPAWKC